MREREGKEKIKLILYTYIYHCFFFLNWKLLLFCQVSKIEHCSLLLGDGVSGGGGGGDIESGGFQFSMLK